MPRTSTPRGGPSTPANSSKKRKVDELNGDPEHRTPASAKPKSSKRKAKAQKDEAAFQLECPPNKLQKTANNPEDDIYIATDSPGVEGLKVEYAVKPGKAWSQMRTYRNVKLQEESFSTGDTVFINRHDPAPKAPAADISRKEMLAFEKKNFWVGKIAEAKADSPQAVYLRVFWLYWPEELPMGKQPYHGENELILSNAMDIVDAQTIAWIAETSFWDENNDDDEALKERFYRQTFDISKLGTSRKGGLSEMRRHCICNDHYNPDRTMYKCRRSDCGIWQHEECLHDAVLEKMMVQLKDGSLHGEVKKLIEHGDQHHTLLGDTIQAIEGVGQAILRKGLKPALKAIADEALPEVHPDTQHEHTPKGRSKKEKKPWGGHFSAIIEIGDGTSASDGRVRAIVKYLGKDKPGGTDLPEQWTFPVECLKCARPLD